jgi:hypothetical protein
VWSIPRLRGNYEGSFPAAASDLLIGRTATEINSANADPLRTLSGNKSQDDWLLVIVRPCAPREIAFTEQNDDTTIGLDMRKAVDVQLRAIFARGGKRRRILLN